MLFYRPYFITDNSNIIELELEEYSKLSYRNMKKLVYFGRQLMSIARKPVMTLQNICNNGIIASYYHYRQTNRRMQRIKSRYNLMHQRGRIPTINMSPHYA